MPFEVHFGCWGVALDLILEALGDAKGLAWFPEWPGDARMGWMALPSGREHCFAGIQGSRQRPKWKVIWFFGGYCIPVNIRQSAIRLGK